MPQVPFNKDYAPVKVEITGPTRVQQTATKIIAEKSSFCYKNPPNDST